MRGFGRLVLSVVLSVMMICNFPVSLFSSVQSSDISICFKGIKVTKDGGVAFLWDKNKGIDKSIREIAGNYFFVGLTVPEENWWTNLNLFISPDESLGEGLEFTSVGKVLMEADVMLKRYAMRLMSQFLGDELAHLDGKNVSFRFWIEPARTQVLVNDGLLRLTKTPLQVRVEVLGDASLQRKIKERVIPSLNYLVNHNPEFAHLRLAHRLLLSAWWYKRHYRNAGKYAHIIDNNTVRLATKDIWTRSEYIGWYVSDLILAAGTSDSYVSIACGGVSEKEIDSRVEEKQDDSQDIKSNETLHSVDLVPAGNTIITYGDIDTRGISLRGPLAIISEVPGKVSLKDVLPRGVGSVGNEIIWIVSRKQVRRIRPPKQGKRGIFVGKNKAVTIDEVGFIREEKIDNPDLISFGTSGWRFTTPVNLQGEEKEKEKQKLLKKMEVALHGFADYYFDIIGSIPPKRGEQGEKVTRKGVVIVRDSRYMGKEFVELAVDVLTGRGIPVYVVDKKDKGSIVCPTPVAAYATDYFNAAFAINFTASHNPVEYNGFKVTPYDGGAAPEEVTNQIQKRINELMSGLREYPKDIKRKKSLITEFRMGDLLTGYSHYVVNTLKSLLGDELYKEIIKTLEGQEIEVVTSALYGSTGRTMDKVLKDMGIFPKVLNSEPDSLFGGLKAPEPSEEMLGEEKKVAEGVKVGIGFISMIKEAEGRYAGFVPDGDGDRVVIVDSKGNYINANYFMGLVVDFLNKYGKRKGGIVLTVPSSNFGLNVAKKYKRKAVTVKVGFKWMREYWDDEEIAVAGEESAHIGIPGTLTWDDGIFMGILGVLMEAYYRKNEGKSLSDVIEELEKEVGYHRYKRINVGLTDELKKSLKELFDTLYADNGGKVVGGDKIYTLPMVDWKKVEVDYGKRISEVMLIDGIKVVFEDGSWFGIRLSGTEPVARLYTEGIEKQDGVFAEKRREKIEEVGRKFLDGGYFSSLPPSGGDNNGGGNGNGNNDNGYNNGEEDSERRGRLAAVVSYYIRREIESYDENKGMRLVEMVKEAGFPKVAYLLAADLLAKGLVPIDVKEVVGFVSEIDSRDLEDLKWLYSKIKKLGEEGKLIVPEELRTVFSGKRDDIQLKDFEKMRRISAVISGGMWYSLDTKERVLGIEQKDGVLIVGPAVASDVKWDEKDRRLGFMMHLIDGNLDEVFNKVFGQDSLIGIELKKIGLREKEKEALLRRLGDIDDRDVRIIVFGEIMKAMRLGFPELEKAVYLSALRFLAKGKFSDLHEMINIRNEMITYVKSVVDPKLPVPMKEDENQKMGGVLFYQVVVA